MVPWVVASLKMVTLPAGARGTRTKSWCSPSRRRRGSFTRQLWLPGMQHKPPVSGPLSVRLKAATPKPCRAWWAGCG